LWRISGGAFVVALGIGVAAVLEGAGQGTGDDITVHEWGTFTSVAGQDGRPIQWAPLDGPQNLPCFVSQATPGGEIKAVANWVTFTPAAGGPAATPVSWRSTLRATVRMETPVLYFYSAHDAQVNVHIAFPQGLITEWYPQALAPGVSPNVDLSSYTGRLDWNGVKILPHAKATFPSDESLSHYYAARETDAAPVEVAGERERFLFYRGVAAFPVPLDVRLAADGAVTIAKTGTAPVGATLLFQNHDGRLGYTLIDAFDRQTTVSAPALTSDVQALGRDLERLLVAQGLYPREAAAMVATWRDSWFEEGTRVIYLWPQAAIDARLPLTIQPAPASTARVFVGRVEVVTPDDEAAVASAIRRNDLKALTARGRWLEPIARRILASATPAVTSAEVQTALRAVADSATTHNNTCH
jgi:hypothetical protein